MRFMAEMGMNWAQSDGNPWKDLPPNDFLAATSELTIRLTKEYPKLPFGIHTISVDGHTHAIEETVVAEKNRFASCAVSARLAPGGAAHPAGGAASGHHATCCAIRCAHWCRITKFRHRLARRPHRPACRRASSTSMTTWRMSWSSCVAGAGSFVMSVCQPTVPVLCAVSLMAAQNDPLRPKAMIMMGGQSIPASIRPA